jgi:hypothetical protein
MFGEVQELCLSIRCHDRTACYLYGLSIGESAVAQCCLGNRQVLELVGEEYYCLGFILRAICLNREPLGDALRALAFPTIRPLYLANRHSAERIASAADLVGDTNEVGGILTSDDIDFDTRGDLS